MKLVLFLLDAFRADYITIEETPFLYQCSKDGRYIKKIKPSAGFCERTEMFTGLKPNESGFFTAIGFDPANSPYKNHRLLKYIGKTERLVFDLINAFFPNKNVLINKILRKLVVRGYKLVGGNIDKLKFYNIPLSFLPYFCLTEDKKELEEQSFKGTKTIFQRIKERGDKYFLGSFTSLGKLTNGVDADRLKVALEVFSREKNIFTPIYLSKADTNGHLFGPYSAEMKQTRMELDKIIEESVTQFLAVDKETVFMFLGDHGMSAVTTLINIEERISTVAKINNLKSGLDYLYFLDSTIFRMWFLNAKARDILEVIIKKDGMLLEHGTFISEEVAQKYFLPVNDRRYGDLAWWANNGVLIFPDFFHKKSPYKGMHGYQPVDFSTFGTCLIWGANIEQSEIEEKHLFHVYDEILNIIEN